MGLLSHGIAVGIGYLLGSPQGRERLNEVGRQAAELGNRPEVVRLKERGKSVAAEQAESVKQKVRAKTARADGGESAVGSNGSGEPARRTRRGLRLSTDRFRRRSATTHFPPSEGAVKAGPLGGTTVMEDSQAAVLGVPTTKTEPPTSTTGG